MNKNEAQYTTKFVMPWSRQYRKLYPNHVIEAKYSFSTICDTDFEPQQLPSLRSAKQGISTKIADGSGKAAPADIISVKGRGFIAAIYHQKGWAIIPINVWDKREIEHVTWEDAKKLAIHYYNERI